MEKKDLYINKINKISLEEFYKLNIKSYSHIKKECSDNSFRFDFVPVKLNEEVKKAYELSKNDAMFTGKIAVFIHEYPDNLEQLIKNRKEWLSTMYKNEEILDIWARNSILNENSVYCDKFYTQGLKRCFLLFDLDIYDVLVKRNKFILTGEYEVLTIPCDETKAVYLIDCGKENEQK